MHNAHHSARWIQDFEKQIHRRQHVILYGNIHDQFLWRGNYQGIEDFLQAYFQDLTFDLVVNYDPIDGFRFAQPEMRSRFDQLARQRLVERQAALGDTPAAPTSTPPVPANPLTPPPRGNPGAIARPATNRIPPDQAFGQLRSVMSQSQTAIAAIVDLGDMLTSDADRYAAEERDALVLLKKGTLEAQVLREGDFTGYRNTTIILASDLKRVPVWFYANHPFVSLVQVTHPDKDERRQFALRFAQGFYGGDRLIGNPAAVAATAEDFADLTDGFQTMDLEALRHTSWRESIPLSQREVFRLIDFYKFGLRDEPFEKLNPDKVRRAHDDLSRAVIGQPRAIDAVTTMLTSAKVGITMGSHPGRNSKPKGVFFFVGPTGVGKTELAKSLSRLIFGDEDAFARFDMSEYKEEHAAEKLAGAPPGFVGYEEGGQLTNRVLTKPHSILLFDEIEKAHPKVLDKFLQILEDGRLTDGKGQTAYFNQTVIIFTSNIGASDLTDPQTGHPIRPGIMQAVQAGGAEQFPYAQVDQHFRTEVGWYFSSRIGRAELLNRLGDNIVVFDLLRPDFVTQIAEKFLAQLQASAADKLQVQLQFEPSVLTAIAGRMREDDHLLFGGRRIKTLIESLVERPLNRWIFEHYPDLGQLHGTTLAIALTPDGQLQAQPT